MGEIIVNKSVAIREQDLAFETSRSSGPGGQHVNTADTRVTAVFDLDGCETLKDSQKQRIRKRLSSRIDKQGRLRVTSQKFRSQHANRQAAVERLTDLLRDALKTRPPRKKTKPSRASKERRLKAKKERGEIKKLRSKPVRRQDLL